MKKKVLRELLRSREAEKIKTIEAEPTEVKKIKKETKKKKSDK